jgi:hypothetical protein
MFAGVRNNMDISKHEQIEKEFLKTLDIVQANLSHVLFLSEFGKSSFIDAYRTRIPIEDLRTYVDKAFSEELIEREIKNSEALYLLCKDENDMIYGYAKFVNSEAPDCVVGDKPIETLWLCKICEL